MKRTSILYNGALAALAVIACALFLSPSAQAEKKNFTPTPVRVGGNDGLNGGTCAGVPGNIVANCGFETGDFTGWLQSGDPSFTGVRTDPFGIGFPNSGAY